MEQDIYDILGRHFTASSSDADERLVAEFRSARPEEYEALKKLFAGKEIKIRDFDSAQAWSKVLKSQRSQAGGATIVPMYSRWLKIAAAVALLLVSWWAISWFSEHRTESSNESLVALGHEQDSLLLPDGSVVWLNADARLVYPAAFTGQREVSLTGEAFFDVAKDPEKPFLISTPDAQVKVLGTSFNVDAQSSGTAVSVATGRVEVASSSSANKVVLNAGYSALVSESKVSSFVTDNQNYRSWHTGTFVFENTQLKTVVEDLNTYYGQKLELAGNGPGCELTAKFQKLPLEEVLEILKLTCNISIEKTPDGFTLKADPRL